MCHTILTVGADGDDLTLLLFDAKNAMVHGRGRGR
jgi:hypothetical protein